MPTITTPSQTSPKPPHAIAAAKAVVDRLKAKPAPTLAQLGELIDEAMKDRRPNPGVCHCSTCLEHLAKHGESKLARNQRQAGTAPLPVLPR